MSEDNVWASGAANEEVKTPTSEAPEPFSYRGEQPNVGEVLSYVFQDVGKNTMAYVWAGLPVVAYLLLFLGALVLGMTVLIVGMVSTGVDPDSPEFAFSILGVYALIILVIPFGYFVQIAAYRAIWWHLSGQEALSWSSGFRAAFTRPGHSLGLVFLTAPLMLVGILMCYVPALGVLLWMHLAVCVMIVDEVGPLAAYKKAFGLFRSHTGYHAKMVGMGTLLEVAIMQIPFLGWIGGYPIGGAMHLVAYKESQREMQTD